MGLMTVHEPAKSDAINEELAVSFQLVSAFIYFLFRLCSFKSFMLLCLDAFPGSYRIG